MEAVVRCYEEGSVQTVWDVVQHSGRARSVVQSQHLVWQDNTDLLTSLDQTLYCDGSGEM